MIQKKNLFLRLLLAGGVVGPILFILVLLLEGAIRPGYNAWHMVGSLLELSAWGWMQRANFIVCGVLLLCFALGLRGIFRSGIGSLWGPLLLAIFGLGLIVAGFSSLIQHWAILLASLVMGQQLCMDRSIITMASSISSSLQAPFLSLHAASLVILPGKDGPFFPLLLACL